MYPGHNCTNYAAYRLIRNGVDASYLQGQGNAWQWCGVAASRGIKVDGTPRVGDIAWWDSTAGVGSDGHVAYVEQVGDGFIVTSDDTWGGNFHWRKRTAGGSSWPTGFIHFGGTVAPTTTGHGPTLARNGGLEGGGAWNGMAAGTNFVVYQNGQVAGESAKSGRNYGATNTPTSGGGVYQDVAVSAVVGDIYCASAWVRTQAPATGARGTFTVWLLGGAYNENGTTSFSGLGNGAGWQQVQTCVSASTPQTTMRISSIPRLARPPCNSTTFECSEVRVVAASVSPRRRPGPSG